MIADYGGKIVLVTGGTMGLGLATALAFGRRGARCVLTYRWGSADEGEVRSRFEAAGAPPPMILQADAANASDTAAVVDAIKAAGDRVEALVSNVSGALVIKALEDYSARGLAKSIDYSAWPMFEYLHRIKEGLGRYPRYVVGMSSTGPDHFSVGYDFVATSKAVMETFCRYLTYRLRDEDCRINVVRSRAVRTASFDATFGPELTEFAKRYVPDSHFIRPEEVADATLALCSGLFDAMRGQVITVDRGTTFSDNLQRLYSERKNLGL